MKVAVRVSTLDSEKLRVRVEQLAAERRNLFVAADGRSEVNDEQRELGTAAGDLRGADR